MSRIHEALKKAEQELALAQQRSAVDEPARDVSAAEWEKGQTNSMPAVASETLSESGVSVPRSVPRPAQEVGSDLVSDFRVADTGEEPFAFQTLATRCQHVDWKPDTTCLLFCNGHATHGVGSEEFRTLRSRLYQLQQQQQLKKLLVTSPMPRDGKSFVAANLAHVIARQKGRRVLLIDADLRWSRLHLSLGAPLSPGLADYLRGDADEYAILQRGTPENLLFIPGGRPSANASELINNGRMRTLLQRLEGQFDWIVLDSPPAVPVADASQLADACDGVLLVVRSAMTSTEMARKARQEFRPKAILGVVLNGVEPKSTYGSYYYGAYALPSAKRKRKA